VREALFSILGPVDGARVLDLFAGSGALAIEALSRGAAQATLVDSSAAAVAAIRRNLTELGADAEVRRQRALAFCEQARRDGRQYDLVFLDPPYQRASGLGRQLSTALEPLLAAGARVNSESDRRAPLALELPLVDERRYGDTLIRIHGHR
jgi:16S rRNA (guanine966-N2)-methyltransferase